MPNANVYLGPLLGFLFTAAALLFIALNAHKTGERKAAESETP